MDDYKLEKLKTSRKMASDGWVYAIQRMDLLIISISGAGVWVVLETIKYAYEKKISDLLLVKLSGIIFVLSMMVNFTSQWTGKNCNRHHISMCDEKILAKRLPSKVQKDKIDKFNQKAAFWDTLTDTFNVISMILMLAGLGVIMAYFLTTF